MPPLITSRIQAPWQSGHIRHHILPYNTLADTWNRLAHAFTGTQLPEARTAIRQFLGTCNHRLGGVDALLDRMRKNELTVPEGGLLCETAVWSAWNIVEGPRLRSDDPRGAGLDRFTFGVTPEEFRRMHTIEILYGDLQRFLAAPTADPATLRALTDSLVVPRRTFAFVDRPIPFRPEMWELEHGYWHKRRSGEQFLTAVR